MKISAQLDKSQVLLADGAVSRLLGHRVPRSYVVVRDVIPKEADLAFHVSFIL